MNKEYARQELIPDAVYLSAAAILSVIGIVGFLSNACVIFIMLREPQLWTPQNTIIFNLALSDFAVSVLGNPVTLAAAISKGWIFGHTICIAYGFFMALLGIASITTLTVLAYDRYLMIRYPFSSSRLTKETAGYAIAGIWMYAFLVTAPPLFGWNSYVNESANISCSVDWESGEHSNYVIYLFMFGLFIPLTVIVYSYVSLVITVRKRASEKMIGQATKAECRVAIMVAVMILAFMAAWTPYAMLALLIAFWGVQINPIVSIIPALCAKSSICWNPVIYIGLNTQFRSAWKRFLKIPGAPSDVSYDGGDPNTGLSKLMAGGHQEPQQAPSADNNAAAEESAAADDRPSRSAGLCMTCCLAHDVEHRRRHGCEACDDGLEMSASDKKLARRSPGECAPELQVGDVSL